MLMKKDIIIRLFLSPIYDNVVFFVFMYLLGVVNSLIEFIILGYRLSIFIFFSQILDVYLLCMFIILFPIKIRDLARWFVSSFLYILSIVNIFCVEKFRAKLGPEIFNVILETNSREASEFWDKYIGCDIIWSSVLLIVVLFVLHWLISLRSHSLRKILFVRLKNKRVLYPTLIQFSLVLLILVCCACSLSSRINLIRLLLAPDISSLDKYVDNKTLNTPLNNFAFSYKMHQLSVNGLNVLVKSQDKIQIEKCSYLCDKVVLIIGESYIKTHSQLYGYNKMTTPRQVARTMNNCSGRLIVYEDVISPSNLTSTVFKNVFSLHSVEDTTNWEQYPLLPVIFRKAGYNVTFITNQFVKSLSTDVFNFSGGLFLNDSRLSQLQFDHRNNSAHRYDEGLLQDYDSLCIYNQEHNLIIFHLAGQHFDFDKRSPNSYKRFSADDYVDRKDLDKAERQLVADYDNATFYNDFVVDEIIGRFENDNAIVIYMPDHGEECYDEIHRMGRMPSGYYSAEMARQEFRIPFWIWCSDKFSANNPSLLELINSSKRRPFMTDDLPHMILFLAGISCQYYNDEKNVLSNNFNSHRVRLIDGKVDYDELVK
jgi:heptose-I-phosphate ethanolaminephosphotransferase